MFLTIPSVQHGNVIWDSLSFLAVFFNPKFNHIAELAWVPTHHLHSELQSTASRRNSRRERAVKDLHLQHLVHGAACYGRACSAQQNGGQ